MRLFQFINEQLPHIAKAWQARAKPLAPKGEESAWPGLHMHAKPILRAMASDLQALPADTQMEKMDGHPICGPAKQTVTAVQAALQKAAVCDVSRIVSELGALRSAVLSLSMTDAAAPDQPSAGEITRFNQLLDEVLAACAAHHADGMNRGRNTLLSMLAHDLRTPLGGIKMAADYLSMTAQFGEKQAEALDSIKRCIVMMSAAISDVSEYAKLSAGATVALAARNADIASLCRQALSETAAMYPDCEFRFVEFGDPIAHADGDKLKRAFSAILHHVARSGTRQQPVEVAVRDEADAVLMQVGSRALIPDGELQAAFDPMTRVLLDGERPENASTANIGPALFIANRIVAAHGGSIEASSSKSEGTVFRVRIPRIAASSAAMDANALPIKA